MMLKSLLTNTLRKSRAVPAIATHARTMASVADNLGLNLPDKFGHFIGASVRCARSHSALSESSPLSLQLLIGHSRAPRLATGATHRASSSSRSTGPTSTT